jgi:hypothetical protein
MNETEWLESTDPDKMLTFLRETGTISERKARLFACAAVRRVWHLLTEERSRRAVEAAEGYADDLIPARELRRCHLSADKAAHEAAHPNHAPFSQADPAAAYAATDAAGGFPLNVVQQAASAAFNEAFLRTWSEEVANQARSAEHREHCHLSRELFGPLPFHPVQLKPSLLTAQNGLVMKLAQAAYQNRSLPDGLLDTVRLAVLADAVEEFGGADEVVAHLRSPGPHVTGCWAIDLLVGKS